MLIGESFAFHFLGYTWRKDERKERTVSFKHSKRWRKNILWTFHRPLWGAIIIIIMIIIIMFNIFIVQISIWIWSKLMCFTILEEIKSTLHKSLFYNYYYSTNQINSNQIKCWSFWWEGKTEVPGEKTYKVLKSNLLVNRAKDYEQSEIKGEKLSNWCHFGRSALQCTYSKR